jgi:hypothetical protein
MQKLTFQIETEELNTFMVYSNAVNFGVALKEVENKLKRYCYPQISHGKDSQPSIQVLCHLHTKIKELLEHAGQL